MGFVKWTISVAFLALLGYMCFYTVPCEHKAFSGVDTVARIAFIADPQIEGDSRIMRQGLWGHIDVVLNDIYFRYIASTVARLKPTHAFILGDLFSSQYITDSEFWWRVDRFRWSWKPLYEACPSSVINVTGNHDIGYGNYASPHVINRFEEAFGRTNIRFVTAGHMFVVVNSMVLDESLPSLRRAAWDFVERSGRAAMKEGMPVVLITHVPLYKDKTVPGCDRVEINVRHGRVVDQTHLSKETSTRLLDVLKPVIIFAGHDHNGCYYELQGGVREYTVRSVMGDFGGNVQLLGIKESEDEYEYNVVSCPLVLRMRDVLVLSIVLFLWIIYLVISCALNCIKGSKPNRSHNHIE